MSNLVKGYIIYFENSKWHRNSDVSFFIVNEKPELGCVYKILPKDNNGIIVCFEVIEYQEYSSFDVIERDYPEKPVEGFLKKAIGSRSFLDRLKEYGGEAQIFNIGKAQQISYYAKDGTYFKSIIDAINYEPTCNEYIVEGYFVTEKKDGTYKKGPQSYCYKVRTQGFPFPSCSGRYKLFSSKGAYSNFFEVVDFHGTRNTRLIPRDDEVRRLELSENSDAWEKVFADLCGKIEEGAFLFIDIQGKRFTSIIDAIIYAQEKKKLEGRRLEAIAKILQKENISLYNEDGAVKSCLEVIEALSERIDLQVDTTTPYNEFLKHLPKYHVEGKFFIMKDGSKNISAYSDQREIILKTLKSVEVGSAYEIEKFKDFLLYFKVEKVLELVDYLPMYISDNKVVLAKTNWIENNDKHLRNMSMKEFDEYIVQLTKVKDKEREEKMNESKTKNYVVTGQKFEVVSDSRIIQVDDDLLTIQLQGLTEPPRVGEAFLLYHGQDGIDTYFEVVTVQKTVYNFEELAFTPQQRTMYWKEKVEAGFIYNGIRKDFEEYRHNNIASYVNFLKKWGILQATHDDKNNIKINKGKEKMNEDRTKNFVTGYELRIDPDSMKIVGMSSTLLTMELRDLETEPKVGDAYLLFRDLDGTDVYIQIVSTTGDKSRNIPFYPLEKTTKWGKNIQEYKNNNKGKEKNTMKLFGDVKFGKHTGTDVKMSIKGLAFRMNTGKYVAYQNGDLTDVTDFLIDMDYLYMLPVAIKDIAVGDVIYHGAVPQVVVEVLEKGIKTIKPVTGEKVEILPTKNLFGFDFYTKIVSLIGDNFFTADTDNPFGNLLPLMLMKDGNIDPMMFLLFGQGGNGLGDITKNPLALMLMMDKDGDNNDLLPLLLMQNVFGK